jgi:hypothetical protein
MAPEDERDEARARGMIVAAAWALVAIYAVSTWRGNRVLEAALDEMARSRRRGPVIRTTPETEANDDGK